MNGANVSSNANTIENKENGTLTINSGTYELDYPNDATAKNIILQNTQDSFIIITLLKLLYLKT